MKTRTYETVLFNEDYRKIIRRATWLDGAHEPTLVEFEVHRNTVSQTFRRLSEAMQFVGLEPIAD